MAQRFSATWISQQITPIVGEEHAQLVISVFKGMMGRLYSDHIFRELLPAQTCCAFAVLYCSMLESIRLYAQGIDEKDPGAPAAALAKLEQVKAVVEALTKPVSEDEKKADALDEASLDQTVDALLKQLGHD